MAGILSGSALVARFVAPMSVISNRPVFVTDTLSLKQRTGSQANAQRWEIRTQLEPLVGSPSLFIQMITSGDDTPFYIEMPQMFRRNSVGATTAAPPWPAVAVSAPVGAVSISIAGNTGTTVGAGEFITFSNHTKVYMVTAQITNNGFMSIFPPLVYPVNVNNIINVGRTAVKMRVRYNSDTVKGMIYTDGVLMDVGQIGLIEALQ